MDAGVQAGASGDRRGHHNKAVQPPERRGDRKYSEGDNRQMNDNRNRQQRDNNRQPQQGRGGWNNHQHQRGNMRQRGEKNNSFVPRMSKNSFYK